MAGRSKDVVDIQGIINRFRQGHSIKRISRDTGVHRKTVRRYFGLAKFRGWLEGEHTHLHIPRIVTGDSTGS